MCYRAAPNGGICDGGTKDSNAKKNLTINYNGRLIRFILIAGLTIERWNPRCCAELALRTAEVQWKQKVINADARL